MLSAGEVALIVLWFTLLIKAGILQLKHLRKMEIVSNVLGALEQGEVQVRCNQVPGGSSTGT